MAQRVRLVIPFWGVTYLRKLVNVTIPALLAPGNLPALVEDFDVEVVLVTERMLHEVVQRTSAYKNLARLCRVELRTLDDLLTGTSGDYGVVLSYALYRGFADLGPLMTETYLLFLNADFIIADGSYRTLGRLMKEGHRVIHNPSFRAVLEDVMPILEQLVAPDTGVLAVPPREMVALALDHKHLTVKARTVNQRVCHQWRMDQFYWFVDERTLIGYQWPVALVAIRPECVVTEPTLMWDYAFVPDAAPTLPRYFISDSDEFFMLEPQKRSAGGEMIRLGWISPDEIAKDLSAWTTKEQRECGTHLHIFHSSDLPDGLDAVIAESRTYMADIVSRLSPVAQDHRNHTLFKSWFDTVQAQVRAGKGMEAFEPTRAMFQEYGVQGASASVMPTDPSKLTLGQGASMLGTAFFPQSPVSVLRIHVAVNAYSPIDNEVVLGVFANGEQYPLRLATQPVAANSRVFLDVLFDFQVEAQGAIGLEVRIGPALPGTIYINGPDGTVPPGMPVPYFAVVDLGAVSADVSDVIRRHGTGSAALLPMPTGRTRLEHPAVTTISTVLSADPAAATAEGGVSILGYRFVPRNSQSVVHGRVRANAYVADENEVVLAIFRNGRTAPLHLESKKADAGARVGFDVSWDMIAGTVDPVDIDVRIGPARPGTVIVNGPADAPAGDAEIPYIALLDLGDVGIVSQPAEGDTGLPVIRLRRHPVRDTLAFVRGLPRAIAAWAYGCVFGRVPDLKMAHPLWLDTQFVFARLSALRRRGDPRILWVGTRSTYFDRVLADRLDPAMFDAPSLLPARIGLGRYDCCVCDLTPEEAVGFKALYYKIRPYLKNDAEVILYVYNGSNAEFMANDLFLSENLFPDVDESHVYFFGNARSRALRDALVRVTASYQSRPWTRRLYTLLTMLGLAPLVLISNAIARLRDPSMFEQHWSSMAITMRVLRHRADEVPDAPVLRRAAAGG